MGRAREVAEAAEASSRCKKFVAAAVATFTTMENSVTGKEEEAEVATMQMLKSGVAMAELKPRYRYSSRRGI